MKELKIKCPWCGCFFSMWISFHIYYTRGIAVCFDCPECFNKSAFITNYLQKKSIGKVLLGKEIVLRKEAIFL